MPASEVSAQKWMSRMAPEELKELFGLQELPASSADLDPNDLPNEDLESFSYEGLSFEEAAEQLWRHTKILHYHAGTCNRQSEWFPVICAQLEKDIRLAGSFCITKAVLEIKGIAFKKIGNFSIESLCGLTAFYFRKCGKAFEDLYYKAGLVSIPMHDWERRWYMLGDRLKATAEKIRKIYTGEVRVDDMLKHIEPVQKKDPAGTDHKCPSEPEAFYLMGKALPLIGSYARQVMKERKHESRLRRQQQRMDAFLIKAKSELEKLEQNKQAEIKKQKSETKDQKSIPDRDRVTDEAGSIKDKRGKLIREAKERNDTKEMMRIAAAPPEEINRIWDMRTAALHKPPAPVKRAKKKKRFK